MFVVIGNIRIFRYFRHNLCQKRRSDGFCACLSICIIVLSSLIVVHYVHSTSSYNRRSYLCNSQPRFTNKLQQSRIGIVGPNGSGVLWLQQIVEQMTGILTRNLEELFVDMPPKFDSRIDKVIGIGTDRLSHIPAASGAIVLYRPLEESVRAHFSEIYGKGSFLEAPLRYYGNQWNKFAWAEAKQWGRTYLDAFRSNVSILVVHFSQLFEQESLHSELLRLSHFLKVPVRASVLRCIQDSAQFFPTLPNSLKSNFHPFKLLPVNQTSLVARLQNDIEKKLKTMKENYKPKLKFSKVQLPSMLDL